MCLAFCGFLSYSIDQFLFLKKYQYFSTPNHPHQNHFNKRKRAVAFETLSAREFFVNEILFYHESANWREISLLNLGHARVTDCSRFCIYYRLQVIQHGVKSEVCPVDVKAVL